MHLCNLGTVEPPGSELSPIDWGFAYHIARRARVAVRARDRALIAEFRTLDGPLGSLVVGGQHRQRG